MVYEKLLAGQKQSVSELTAVTMEDVDIQFVWSIVSNLEEEEEDAKLHCGQMFT